MKANLKTMAVLVVAAATMAGPAFAGQTQAEREAALRQVTDPENGQGWQIRPSLDTGSLPVDETGEMKSESGAKEEVPTVEIGGKFYRIGIDMP